jgi:hypothetical protein
LKRRLAAPGVADRCCIAPQEGNHLGLNPVWCGAHRCLVRAVLKKGLA